MAASSLQELAAMRNLAICELDKRRHLVTDVRISKQATHGVVVVVVVGVVVVVVVVVDVVVVVVVVVDVVVVVLVLVHVLALVLVLVLVALLIAPVINQ